jgi:hypothetical protein
MSKAIRQENLYGAEDWTVIYTSFKNAEFKSYDFDTLRQAMVDYMQVNYAEEFNDYIQNSEFIALLDLVAFTGQNLAFRMDLNARENILDTAEKRESVLRIARMLSYKPKRVRPAQGLLKIVSVTTTAQLFDSTGNNLANQIITWGADPSELDYERFVRIMNDALGALNPIGTPVQRMSNNESGIVYETYDFNNSTPIVNQTLSAAADGLNLSFEIVPVKLDDAGMIAQKEPDFSSSFSMLYRNDGKGVGSAKTGFFLLTKQGYTVTETRRIQNPQASLVLDLANTPNISEDDFFVQTVDDSGNILKTWDRVGTLDLTNIVSSGYGNKNRDLFEVIYSDADVTSVKFGDGDFSNAPSGNIRLWYRIAQNDYVRVKTGDITGANFEIQYTDSDNNQQSVFLKLDLQENMITGLPAESITEIKNNAPEAFYSKNRMVTGDDYNGFLATLNNDVLLLKAENRTFSGHSRYVDLRDPTGKSRPLIEFADDGYLYREETKKTINIADVAANRSIDLLRWYIERSLNDIGLLNFYYGKLDIVGTGETTKFPTVKLNEETDYYTRTSVAISSTAALTSIDVVSINSLDPYDSFDESGGLVKINNELFTYTGLDKANNRFLGIKRAQQGTTAQAHVSGSKVTRMFDIRWRSVFTDLTSSNGYFSHNNYVSTPTQLGFSAGDVMRNLRPGALIKLDSATGDYEWTAVLDVSGDGLGVEDIYGNYTGKLQNGNGPVELSKSISGQRLLTEILPTFPRVFDDYIVEQALVFLDEKRSFGLAFDNLNGRWTIIDPDNTAGLDEISDFDSKNISTSWLIYVKRVDNSWNLIARQLDYVFGSRELIRFYNINFLPSFNTTFKNVSDDEISILSLGSDSKLKTIQKYKVSGYYVYDDGYTDNSKVKVSPIDADGDFLPDDPENFADVVNGGTLDIIEYQEGDFSYYVPAEGGNTSPVIKTVDGRDGVAFKWTHITGVDQTLNPSLTNIIDAYVLTKTYNEDFIAWKRKNNNTLDMPLPQTTEELRSNFRDISTFKMMTDEVIFHPAKFKPLFGSLSDPEFQATFKVVKNAKSRNTDNEIKSKVISAIDEFFAPGNFDFGEVFYFTELSTFVHNKLDGDINSIVIVPSSTNGRFGTLFQVQPNRDEVVTSVATVNDIVVINEITDKNIRIGR